LCSHPPSAGDNDRGGAGGGHGTDAEDGVGDANTAAVTTIIHINVNKLLFYPSRRKIPEIINPGEATCIKPHYNACVFFPHIAIFSHTFHSVFPHIVSLGRVIKQDVQFNLEYA
jgi:hypothetical protein